MRVVVYFFFTDEDVHTYRFWTWCKRASSSRQPTSREIIAAVGAAADQAVVAAAAEAAVMVRVNSPALVSVCKCENVCDNVRYMKLMWARRRTRRSLQRRARPR